MKKSLYVFAFIFLLFNFSSCTPNSLAEDSESTYATQGEEILEDDKPED